ncbi:3296_t:CDS:2, partial [Ambispora leptoticha]
MVIVTDRAILCQLAVPISADSFATSRNHDLWQLACLLNQVIQPIQKYLNECSRSLVDKRKDLGGDTDNEDKTITAGGEVHGTYDPLEKQRSGNRVPVHVKTKTWARRNCDTSRNQA